MAYSGYANQKEASEKKIIRNLFKPNQDAFNTGKAQMNTLFSHLNYKTLISFD